MKKIVYIALICMFVLTIITGCGKLEDGDVTGSASDDSALTAEIPVMEIVSDMTNLYYPEKWHSSVDIVETDNVVSFNSKGTKLFDFIFGDTEGSLLGYYDGVEVRIVSYDIPEEDYTEDEYLILREMQEDIDIVIEHLMEDENFVLE